MFEINIQNEKEYQINPLRLTEAALAVLNAHDVHPNSALTLVFTDDDSVAALNTQFRGVEAPTDVLSFPADAPPVDIEGEPPYLGDLVIAYPYARAQAEQEKHTLDDSLALLVVHGILHLLGYDHDTPENRVEMWESQAEALTDLGISPSIVPAYEGLDHDTEA